MPEAVELFIAITAIVIGLSHVLRPSQWAAIFARLADLGSAGAFLNGGPTLIVGAIILAGHRVWTFPGVVLTVFGGLLVAKGAVCFLLPDQALRSMRRGGQSPRSFVGAGIISLAVGAWAIYCLVVR